jgi:hypothetical protein
VPVYRDAMVDVAYVEAMIRTALFGPSPENPSAFRTALDFIQALHDSLDGFSTFVRHYQLFSELISKKLILVMTKQWCLRRWSAIPPALHPSLRALLFETALANYADHPPEFRTIIADAQFAFFWNVYPGGWPNFWTDIRTTHPLILLHFLDAFSSFTARLSFDANSTFVAIKEVMRSHRIDDEIIKFLVSLFETG